MYTWKQRILAGAAALTMLGWGNIPAPLFTAQAAEPGINLSAQPLYAISELGIDFVKVTYDLKNITGLESVDGITVKAQIYKDIPEGADLSKVLREIAEYPTLPPETLRAAIKREYGEETAKVYDLFLAYDKDTIETIDLTGDGESTISGLTPETSYTVVFLLEKDSAGFMPVAWSQQQFRTGKLLSITSISEDLVEYNGFRIKWETEGDAALQYVIALYKGVPELDLTEMPATTEEAEALINQYEEAEYVDLAFVSGSETKYGKGALDPDTLYTVEVMAIARAEALDPAPALIQVRTPLMPGDVNGDTSVNATDAARVLIAAAQIGAGQPSGLTDAQAKAANVNSDESINATDAAILLQYAAAVGAGQEDVELSDFVKK